MKKRSGKFWLSLFIFALTLVLPAVSALPATLDNAYRGLVSIGNLSFIGVSDGAMVVGLTRLLIWILVFTIIYALIAPTNKKSPLSFLAKNQAMVVALVMATVAAIFLPASVLMATGAGSATAVALILIGLPVVGVGYLLIKMPSATRGDYFLKLLICLLLFWILTAMKFHVTKIGGAW